MVIRKGADNSLGLLGMPEFFWPFLVFLLNLWGKRVFRLLKNFIIQTFSNWDISKAQGN